MDQDQLKRMAAEAALEYVVPDAVLGVGTGSTTNIFIDMVVRSLADRIEAAVSSSNASTDRLRAHGIRVLQLSEVREPIPVYVDGADEFDPMLNLIKGGGGALTREKIMAQAARQFICIVDGSKRVDKLGRFPLPIEVIPMAVELVKNKVEEMGGRPRVRPNVITDNGNVILDVRGLSFDDPTALEEELDSFPGVVTCGIFSRRRADVVLMGTPEGVLRYRWKE